MNNVHEMVLLMEIDDVEIWMCLTCYRQAEITWNPFSFRVIEDGDMTVKHIGGKGGLNMEGTKADGI